MPILMLYTDIKNLDRIHKIILLFQPMFKGEVVVDREDRNMFHLIKTPNGAFFKVKQEDKHFLLPKQTT